MAPSNEPPAAATEKFTTVADAEAAPSGYLLYVAGEKREDRGKTLQLDRGEAVVGSDSSCDLRLVDASVSRQHLRLVVQADGLMVEDLGSTNGTTYLGQRIGSVLLQSGARLSLGRCALDVIRRFDGEPVTSSTLDQYGALKGTSPAMRRLFGTLELLEGSEVPLLIQGETGTGKELVARAVHDRGTRADKTFVTIDCAGIPSNLIESELFGHRKGAFTGATADRKGAFEAADGGTVFLDELGELPLELQPKLLRVLETGEIRRIGDTGYVSIDVRVLSATHRDLKKDVAAGRFREDLYYRVAVVRVSLPTLRDRREDIPLLANHLAAEITGGAVRDLPPAARDFLMRHSWPGNVRELRNAVHQMVALGRTDVGMEEELLLKPEDVNEQPTDQADYHDARSAVLQEFERDYVADLISRHSDNLSEAARAAGLDRKYLRKLLKKHGLYKPTDKGDR